MTWHPSPSTVFQANPPILVNFNRPLLLISFTIAPNVSTCAVRARGGNGLLSPACKPFHSAIRAPFTRPPQVEVRKFSQGSLRKGYRLVCEACWAGNIQQVT